MIFAVATDERSLQAFESEAAAIARCEGLDVEAGDWLFWDNAGNPLEAEFLTSNRRGLLVVANGTYKLVPASPDHHAHLQEAVHEILSFEGVPPFNSRDGVLEFLRGQPGA